MKAFEGHWDTTASAHLFHSHWSSHIQPLMKSRHKASINNLSLPTSVRLSLWWWPMLSLGWTCHISWVEINVSALTEKVRCGVALFVKCCTCNGAGIHLLHEDRSGIQCILAMSITACLNEPNDWSTYWFKQTCVHTGLSAYRGEDRLTSWEGSKENEPHANGKLFV